MPSSILLSDNGASSGSAGIKSTGGNDGVLLLQTTTSGGTATTAVTLDNNQNMGLGVTPSAWDSTFKSFEIGAVGNSVAGQNGASQAVLSSNAYYNAGWKYARSTLASQFALAGGQAIWYTAASGTAGNAISFTQAMTLDASGNLLVGTTTASSKLTVNSEISMGADGDNRAIIGYTPSRFYIGTRQSGTNYFDTVSVSSGNLLVGTTSQLQSSKLSVLGTGNVADFRTSSSSGYPVVCENTASGSTSMIIFLTGPSTTTVGSITYNGSLTLYNTTSDQRLKENITDSASASELVNSLQVRQYDWKASGNHQRYGFVAQELVTVVPEAVHQPEDPEEMMAVDYSKLVPMLIKAHQEQQAIITQLQADVAALKGAQA